MGAYRQLKDEHRREKKAAEKLKPATPAMLKRAKQLGKKGVLTGKKAPAQDAKILDMCNKKPHNTAMKLMAAWQKGGSAEHRKQTDAELEKAGFWN